MKFISNILFIFFSFFSSFFSSLITKSNSFIINIKTKIILSSFDLSPSVLFIIPVRYPLNRFIVLFLIFNSFCSLIFFSLSAFNLSISSLFLFLKKNPPFAVCISLSNLPISIIPLMMSFPISLKAMILSRLKFFSKPCKFVKNFLLSFSCLSIYLAL